MQLALEPVVELLANEQLIASALRVDSVRGDDGNSEQRRALLQRLLRVFEAITEDHDIELRNFAEHRVHRDFSHSGGDDVAGIVD